MNTRENRIIRKASPNEIVYTDMQDLYCSLAIQFIVEGIGDVEKDGFEEAVKKASLCCPSSYAILVKNKWVQASSLPMVHYIEDSLFDGYNFNEIDLFKKKMDYKEQPATEIYVFKGDVTRILFRIFHAVMDGRGALLWVENIFRAYRGEKLIRPNFSMNDIQFLNTLDKIKVNNKLGFNISILNNDINTSNSTSVYWKRLTIKNKVPGLIAKISSVLTEEFESEENRFMIPVDIRSHGKDIISNANLTFPVFLKTKKGESWEEINASLLFKLKNKEELNQENKSLSLLSIQCKKVRKIIIKSLIGMQRKVKKYMVGGVISHIGKIELEKMSTDDFKATCFYSVPVQQPLAPMSLVAAENDNTTEIVFVTTKNVLDEKSFSAILQKVKDKIEVKPEYSRLTGTKTDIDDDNSVIDLFLKSVKNNPQGIALIDNQNKMTYRELDEKANSLVYLLKNNNWKKQSKVILYLEREFELIISIVATLKLAGIYISVDTNISTDRVKNMMENNTISFIVTSNKYMDEFKNLKDIKVFYIEDIDFGFKEAQEIEKNSSDDILYQIYTTGTTGTPKAIQIQDKSLKNYLCWAKKAYNVDESSVFPLFTSISVDLTITSIFLPLISGGSIKLYKDNTSYALLRDILMDYSVTYLKCTPTHLRLINELQIKVENKKVVIVGGEQFDVSLAKRARETFGQTCKIVNEYGPAEATVGCIYYTLGTEKMNDIVPIGQPIDNTSIMLLDNSFREVQKGGIGEIYISGECLAKGYFNSEEMNQKKFVYIAGQRMYKTGDLCKLDDNKNYIYLGRIDSQVKIRGYRVELEEIQTEINKFDVITNCIVIYDKTMVAYFTSNKIIDIKQLREYLGKRLPSYMIPNNFVQVDEFRTNGGGKVDIEYLKGFLLSKSNKETCATIIDSLEGDLINIWADILKLENKNIQISDDFFDLGGDSLGVITMILKISQLLHIVDEKEFTQTVMENYDDITIHNIIKIISKLG